MSQGKFEDLTGTVFGKLTVLYRAADYVQPSGQHKRMWHCKCECGNECDVRAADLKTGNTSSCGCFQQFSRGKSTFLDLTGKRFGRFIVLNRLPNHITPSGQNLRMWHCLCDCGKEFDVYGSQIKNKKSCGCLSEEEKQKKAIEKKKKEAKNKEIRKVARKIIASGDLDTVDQTKNKELQRFIVSEVNRKKSYLNSKQRDKELRAQKRKERLKEYNLAIKYPEVAKEWHPTKNGNRIPEDFTPKSNEKVWWLCPNGHSYESLINSRTSHRKTGCPYCSNKRILEGYNDLASTNPELLSEWDYNKNKIKPTQITAGVDKMIWWICPMGHSYDMRVHSRTGKGKSGCPYCSIPAKRVLKGFNDLQTLYPDIAKEWHPIKNGEISPDQVLCGSAQKVWWKGKCGHEYEQAIVSRVQGGNCPYCSHQKLLSGFNDFATLNPELLKEWDYEKNTVLPTEISTGANVKIWWKCPFGHSYQAYPHNRAGETHTGCTICSKENHTSFPEQALFYYINLYFPDAVNSDREAIGMELDIYIPSYKTAIEYDGKQWHKSNSYEAKKNERCVERGIRLIRIREEGLTSYENCTCLFRDNIRSNDSLSDVIAKAIMKIDSEKKPNVAVDRDSAIIYNSYIKSRKERSLYKLFPILAAEWHPIKNGEVTAEMVAPLSSKKVWWLGKCGHEWMMSVQNRTYQKCGCPICSGKRIVSGINDLKSMYPDLCNEWDYSKNDMMGLFPYNVAPHSDKKAWWICGKCGNEWQAKIDSRTRMKSSCPKCGVRNASEAKYKAVKCIETGQLYDSLKDAEAATGINRTCISNCCKGKQKSAGSYHWEFCLP